MTTFIAKLTTKPGMGPELERLQAELSVHSHQDEPGLVVYDVLRSRDEPGVYIVYGRFRDEAAFNFHMQAPAHERLVPPIVACLAKDFEIAFYDFVA